MEVLLQLCLSVVNVQLFLRREGKVQHRCIAQRERNGLRIYSLIKVDDHEFSTRLLSFGCFLSSHSAHRLKGGVVIKVG